MVLIIGIPFSLFLTRKFNLPYKRSSKEMEQELVQRTRELETVYEMGALINEHLGDLDVVLSITLKKVANLTGYEMGAIFLLNEMGDVLEMKSQIGHSPAMFQEVKVLKFNEGVSGKAIRLKQPVIVSISEFPSPRIVPILREEGVQTVVGIPLLAKGKAIGAIILSSRSRHRLSQKEVNSLESIGSQVGLALENSLLLNKIRKSEEKYRTVVERAIDGVCVIGRDYIFKYVNERLAQIRGCRREELIGTDFRNLLDEKSRALLADREVKRARGIKSLPHFEINILQKDGGVRNAEISVSAIKDSKGDVNIIVFLKDITDRKKAEEALRQSEEETRRLSQENAVMAEVGRIISSTLNIEEVYERFAEEMQRLIPFDRVSVNTMNPDRASITIAYVSGVEIADAQEGTLVTMEGPFHEDIVNRRSSVLIQTEDENGLAERYPNFVRHFRAGLRSMIATPLISQDQLIGILHIQSLKPSAYTESDVRLAERVGNQIVGAIANAQLFIERKRAEEALRQSEEKYRTIIENIQDSYFENDLAGNFTFVNDSLCRSLGYTKDELIGMNYRHYTDQGNVNKVFQAFSRVYRTGEPVKELDYGVIKKGGAKAFTEISVSLIRDLEGKAIGYRGISRDITERKKMEEALRESENKFRSLVEHSIVGVYLIQDGVFKYVNSRVAEIHGYEIEEMVDKMGPKQATLPEDLSIVEGNIGKRMKGEEGSIHYEFRIFTKGQQIRYVEVFGSHTMYQGKPAVIGTMLDITDRKKAEEALRQSEERYRNILESIEDGYYEVDLAGDLTFFNDSLCRIYGYPKEELIGMTDRQLTDQESAKKLFQTFNRVYRTGEPGKVFDWEVIRKDGTKRYVEGSASLQRDASGKPIGFRGILRDITEKKKVEEQLFQAEKLRAVGEMASGVAHDFNNALAAILGNTQLLLHTTHDGEIKETLKIIEKVAKDSGQTVRRLQDFTRKRVGQELFKVDVNAIIKDSMEMTKPKWKDEPQGRGIRIEVVSNLEEIPSVSGNTSELREVITNMIFNAIEAMPEGGKIEIRTFKKRRDVLIQISDTGIGVAEETKKKIFEPFFTTKPFTNTGLGLSMSYGIIRRFGGEIEVESKLGQGTTFTIILPVGGEEKEEAVSPHAINKGRRALILVIDDDEFVRSVLSRTLAQANHQVTLAENGEKGVQIFKEGKFDIVLTDLGLPGMSGWEVCRMIKETSPQTPVGMITGWGVEKNRSEMEEYGLDFFVSKPFDFNQILNVVSETMASKEE